MAAPLIDQAIEHLRDLYEGLDDFDVRVKGGTVEVFLTERDFIIPASRLSDGTLRYLCLLAILCDPDPPALDPIPRRAIDGAEVAADKNFPVRLQTHRVYREVGS